MKFLSTLTLILAVTTAVVAPAHAQSKRDLAQKVVQLQKEDFEAIGIDVAQQTAQTLLMQAGPAVGAVEAGKREAVAKDVQAEVKKFYDGIVPTLRQRAFSIATSTVPAQLEEKFTEDELKQLVAWLESTTAKKYRALAAEMPAKTAERLVTDTKASVDPRIKSTQQAIEKRLEAAGLKMN